jgi:hypothetical protein
MPATVRVRPAIETGTPPASQTVMPP